MPLVVLSALLPAVGLVTAAAVLTNPLHRSLQGSLVRDPGLSRLGILFELGRTSVEIGFALPDHRKGIGLALLRTCREQGGGLSGVLLDPLEGRLRRRSIERYLSPGHAGQRAQLLLIVLHQGLALGDRVTLLSQYTEPTER
jgi:hypothetical protein